jgi:hypothetical protein
MTGPEKTPSDPLSGTGTAQMQGTSQTQSRAEATQGEGEHLTERARRKAGELAGDLKRRPPGHSRRANSVRSAWLFGIASWGTTSSQIQDRSRYCFRPVRQPIGPRPAAASSMQMARS